MRVNKVTDPQKVLVGREAIQKYRVAHCGTNSIYTTAKTVKSIEVAHTNLMEIMLKELASAGFRSLQEFEKADNEQRLKDGEAIL